MFPRVYHGSVSEERCRRWVGDGFGGGASMNVGRTTAGYPSQPRLPGEASG